MGLMVSDAGDSVILGAAEDGCRTYRDVLPAAAHWLGQPVPKCMFIPVCASDLEF
jgi:hypothetical protein